MADLWARLTQAVLTGRLRPAPSAEDITLFTRELGWMTGAGVPLGQAFDLLVAEGQGGPLGPALRGIRAELRAGSGLAEAMAAQGDTFPEPYIRLIGMAEMADSLPLVLDRLHAGRLRLAALRRRISGAMIYPAFLVAVAVAAVGLIAFAVLPQLRGILPEQPAPNGADAPIRRLLSISDAVTGHLGLVALVTVVAWGAGWFLLRQPALRRALSGAVLRLPVLGPLVMMARLSEGIRSLAMLTEAGLPLGEALSLTRRATPQPRLARMFAEMEAALRAGGDITQPLRADPLVPKALVSLLRVGLETGQMARSLGQAADAFEDKTRLALERALALLEPVIILIISVGVGGMIYTVIGALMAVNDLFV